MKFKTQNGWTKEKMKERIRERNNGTQSRNDADTICAYRGIDDNACAAGCFIEDKDYIPAMEGWVVGGDLMHTAMNGLPAEGCEALNNYRWPISVEGIAKMQKVHDYNNRPDVRDSICDWIDANVEDA